MTLRSHLRALALGLALPLVGGCAGDEPIRIGVALNESATFGARLAQEEINDAGGIEGRPLELSLVVEAYGSPAERVIATAQRFAADPALVAVVGHSGSGSTLAASQVYNARELVHVTPLSTSPALRSAGPYTFRMVPDDRSQGAFLSDLVPAWAGARPAAVYVNDDYGRALHRELRDRLAQRGVALAFEAPFAEGDDPARLRGTAEALVAAGVTDLVWIGRGAELSSILPALRAGLPALRVVGSDAMDNDDFVHRDPGRMDGVRFIRFLDPSGGPEVEAFRARHRARFGREPSTEGILAFDAVMLLAAAIREGARERQALRSHLSTLQRPFSGVSGALHFDATGGADRPYLLARVTPAGVRPALPATPPTPADTP